MANFFKILAIMDLQIMAKKKTYASPAPYSYPKSSGNLKNSQLHDKP